MWRVDGSGHGARAPFSTLCYYSYYTLYRYCFASQHACMRTLSCIGGAEGDLFATMVGFDGRHAVVTGASGGMGRELALQLVEDGCSVALCDVRHTELQETETLCAALASAGNVAHVTVTSHVCDVTDAAAVSRLRDDVCAAHGHVIEILINNAGIATSGSFASMDAERFDRCFNVSWLGTLNMTRAFLPMVRAGTRGWVVNLSSINAFWNCLGPAKFPVRTPPHAPYCAAKAAVRAFSEALHFDSIQNFPHVQVVAVHPGHVGTDIARLSLVDEEGSSRDAARLKGLRSADGQRGAGEMTLDEIQEAVGTDFRDSAPTTASEAARQILSGMRAGSTRVLVGEDAVVIDWLARAFPRLIYQDWFIMTVLFPWVRSAQMIGRPAGLPLGRFAMPALLALLGRSFVPRAAATARL